MRRLSRLFSPDVEALASAWRADVETSDYWWATGSPGSVGGEAQGYFVQAGTVSAYAKPSRIDTSANPVPRAAHEKIAADFAFDLALPVPPAILHRWAPPPVGNERLVALSLLPFLPVEKWQLVKSIPGLEDLIKMELRTWASAMVAFDTWVDNRDRLSPDNLLVSRVDPSGPTRVAYIDYSYSMLYGWRGAGCQNVDVIGIYPTDQKDADEQAMGDVLKWIEGLSDDGIRDVVCRIPDDFLRPADKNLIVDGLLYRQPRVRPALAAQYGGIS